MAHDVDPAAGVGLWIGRARELGATPCDAAGETIGRTARARRRHASKHHVALIDVVAEDAFRVRGRLVHVGELDGRRDPGDRGRSDLGRCASRDIAPDVNRDLRLGYRLGPAAERDRAAWCDARILSEEAHERAGDVELLELRGRTEADLPAERRVAAVEPL